MRLLLLLLLFVSPRVEARGVIADVEGFRYLVANGYFQGGVAKETCSCLFVSEQTLKDCLENTGISPLLLDLLTISVDSRSMTVSVRARLVSSIRAAKASFDMKQTRHGCRLVDPAVGAGFE